MSKVVEVAHDVSNVSENDLSDSQLDDTILGIK